MKKFAVPIKPPSTPPLSTLYRWWIESFWQLSHSSNTSYVTARFAKRNERSLKLNYLRYSHHNNAVQNTCKRTFNVDVVGYMAIVGIVGIVISVCHPHKVPCRHTHVIYSTYFPSVFSFFLYIYGSRFVYKAFCSSRWVWLRWNGFGNKTTEFRNVYRKMWKPL